MLIRRETADDRDVVEGVHLGAFATGDGSPAAEAALVDALRAADDAIPGLCLVAELDGQVVGHVLCSRARLGDRPSVGLGPLGVLPAHQGLGVGSALVHAVLGAADALDLPEVVLLGDPAYYRRFGFRLAEQLGVTAPVPDWAPHFQVRPLGGWRAERAGRFGYAPAFDLV